MRATKHKIQELCPFGRGHITVEICFNFLKGSPAKGQTYSSGGQPADPDEIELISARSVTHPLDDVMQCMLTNWAEDYLADEGFANAREVAASDDEAAREYAAELRADR